MTTCRCVADQGNPHSCWLYIVCAFFLGNRCCVDALTTPLLGVVSRAGDTVLDSGAVFLMRLCGTNVFAWSQSFLGAWAAFEVATLLKNGGLTTRETESWSLCNGIHHAFSLSADLMTASCSHEHTSSVIAVCAAANLVWRVLVVEPPHHTSVPCKVPYDILDPLSHSV